MCVCVFVCGVLCVFVCVRAFDCACMMLVCLTQMKEGASSSIFILICFIFMYDHPFRSTIMPLRDDERRRIWR